MLLEIETGFPKVFHQVSSVSFAPGTVLLLQSKAEIPIDLSNEKNFRFASFGAIPQLSLNEKFSWSVLNPLKISACNRIDKQLIYSVEAWARSYKFVKVFDK